MWPWQILRDRIPAEVSNALQRVRDTPPLAVSWAWRQEVELGGLPVMFGREADLDAFFIAGESLRWPGNVDLRFRSDVPEGSLFTDVQVGEGVATVSVELVAAGGTSTNILFGIYCKDDRRGATFSPKTVQHVHDWVRSKVFETYRASYAKRKAQEDEDARNAQQLRDKYR